LSAIVPLRSAKPVLQNILLEGEAAGTVLLTGTDLEVGLQMRLEVDGLQEAEKILLPAAQFSACIRGAWEDQVSLSIQDQAAEIRTPSVRVRLLGSTALEEFPPFPVMDEKKCLELSGADLVDAANRTVFATAKGDTRFAMNGVLFHIEKTQAEFVASDTHRLSLVKKKVRNPGQEKVDAIVITKGVVNLAKIAAGQESVSLQISGHEMMARTSTALLVSRLVDGQFPRYREVIPKDLPNSVTVNREALARAVRLMGDVSNLETRSVSFSAQVAEGRLNIAASGAEVGEGDTWVPAEIKGEDVTVSFNHSYLLEVLKILSGETVTLCVRNAESPVRLDVGDFTHLIMPIKPRG
jgi:DNA polymerase III subunit beta